MVHTKIGRWGNSLAVRIPRPLARELGLREGQDVELSVNVESLTLRPSREEKLQLSKLLEEFKGNETHQDTEWGGPVGQEEW